MSRRLPPLSQLRAFEAAARRRSFKLAADELAVTPAAISHQVKALEELLGMALFERRTRQVVPTAAALRLLPVLSESFDRMAEGLAAMSAARRVASVTLSTTRAFLTQWLMPCLPAFHAKHPEIELRLHADESPVDLAAGEADLAVRYGAGPYPGHDAVELAEDRFAPVCSPLLKLESPRDLQRCPLIHFEWRRPVADMPDWNQWLLAAGAKGIDTSRGLRFSEEVHAIQAAIAGQGVALLSTTLVHDELQRGVLRSPFGPMLGGRRFWLLQHRARQPSAACRAVAQWLLGEAKARRKPQGREVPAAAATRRSS
ncbi:LysR substrate-binding domain-containing protein [Schlegelella sp. S2-27]|uniref:LysR substrate-binding domain-containing protein n=1 Tax=Caldimonas mangrovi TaxID=2944811 RepID=A0ABT0YMS5_9BURK|nr:LysR substrate-binding domain-containing protein [Caldimonas mangrovi]MCM5680030.1 LysR substrate-binding domain-containing protein [Caldimonas mangrovi]